MYNIFLRYMNTVKQVETTEELFNLHNKVEHMARIQWEKENEFDDLCDEVDRRFFELVKNTFNFETTDDLGIEYFRPSIGYDDMYSYVNVLVINHNNNNEKEISEVMGINPKWMSNCENL